MSRSRSLCNVMVVVALLPWNKKLDKTHLAEVCEKASTDSVTLHGVIQRMLSFSSVRYFFVHGLSPFTRKNGINNKIRILRPLRLRVGTSRDASGFWSGSPLPARLLNVQLWTIQSSARQRALPRGMPRFCKSEGFYLASSRDTIVATSTRC